MVAGTNLVRIYDRVRRPTAFNPTASSARFRPIRDVSGRIVPTGYFGEDARTAIAEGLLRGASALAAGAPRYRLYRRELQRISLVTLRYKGDLRLAQLHGPGLTRLGLLRADVIDCDESDYPYTAEWSRSVWGTRARPHGISWTSRQNDSSQAFMLWEGRVDPAQLEVVGDPIPLDADPGLDLVRQLCAEAGIDLEA